MEQAHYSEKIPYTLISDELQLGYSTIMRWKRRKNNREIIIGKPGPKKIEPIDLQALASQINQMKHGIKKTMGTTDLYRDHQNQISRRDLQALTHSVRKIVNIPDQCIEWIAPGVVWSIDDTQYQNTKLQQVQDLSARYKFPVLINKSMTADKIAGHLERLFKQYGPPLFLKRDNAGNLNHEYINQVLTNYWVIPFNSPTYYPPYNGGIEKSQCEVKQWLRGHYSYFEVTGDLLEHLTQNAIHDLNHLPRRVLSGQNACEVFFRDKQNNQFNKRQRKEIFNSIKQTALALLDDGSRHTKHQQGAAWRTAVKLWLEKNNCIRIEKVQKVLPNFFDLLSHN